MIPTIIDWHVEQCWFSLWLVLWNLREPKSRPAGRGRAGGSLEDVWMWPPCLWGRRITATLTNCWVTKPLACYDREVLCLCLTQSFEMYSTALASGWWSGPSCWWCVCLCVCIYTSMSACIRPQNLCRKCVKNGGLHLWALIVMILMRLTHFACEQVGHLTEETDRSHWSSQKIIQHLQIERSDTIFSPPDTDTEHQSNTRMLLEKYHNLFKIFAYVCAIWLSL